jgi:hypothetical protein
MEDGSMTIQDARPFRELGPYELRLQLLDAVHRSEEERIVAQRRPFVASGTADTRLVDETAQARFQQAKLAALLCRFVGDA